MISKLFWCRFANAGAGDVLLQPCGHDDPDCGEIPLAEVIGKGVVKGRNEVLFVAVETQHGEQGWIDVTNFGDLGIQSLRLGGELIDDRVAHKLCGHIELASGGTVEIPPEGGIFEG